jgi:hypothetical protein
MAIGQPIARSSQDLFWLRLTGYCEHCLKHLQTIYAPMRHAQLFSSLDQSSSTQQ